MKPTSRVFIVISGVLLAVSALVLGQDDRYRIRFDRHLTFEDNDLCRENVTLKLEDRALILTCDEGRHEGETVVITQDGQLYIDGERIRLSRKQEREVQDYWDRCETILESAKDIGMEGARIGLKGAAVGVKAVAGLFKCAFSDFTTDDLERELERETRHLEREAEPLERQADAIEEKVDELKRRHKDLRNAIRELKRLEWF